MNFWQTALLIMSIGLAQASIAAEQQSAPAETQYLYIEKFTVPAGRTISDALDEGREWVKAMRGTGDFKNVRLYFHHTGPEVAIYILAEPKNWAAIESGFEKVIEQMQVMEKPFNWAGHGDNLLSEVQVD